MSYERLTPPTNLDAERIELLKQTFPEAWADGKINWDTLKQVLSNNLEPDDDDAEHFGLFWPGKREARRIAASPSRGTLVPMPGEGIDEETTRNIFIEGENLEVLKLLQKSYAGRIKMIYIDPPYNTGNDFVYIDDFKEPLEEYLRRTGQLDEEGKPQSTNTRADGRFHSKWLSMMYPRLKLAKNLLHEHGIICISIDDHECHNLKLLMDELFGEEAFVAQFTWVKKKKGSHLSKTIREMTEYILLYAKDSSAIELFGEEAYSDKWQPLVKRTNSQKILLFIENKVKTTLPDGIYKNGKYGKGSSSIELIDNIKVKNGLILNPFHVKAPFVWTQKKLDDEVTNGTQITLSKQFGFNVLRYNQEDKIKRPSTLLDSKAGVGTNEDATAELIDLFGKENVMSYPKPVSLISYLINSISHEENDIYVLDFFSGSGTTGHATYSLNSVDNGRRKFILVQMPETCEGENRQHLTIAEICKDRLKKAAKVIKKDKSSIDLGFKVFKLAMSNMANWSDSNRQASESLINKLDMFAIPLKKGYKNGDLLAEIMLLEGFPLDSAIEEYKTVKKNLFVKVSSEHCDHTLIACLDEKIGSEVLATLEVGIDDVLICLDSAISDQDKMRLSDHCKLKTI